MKATDYLAKERLLEALRLAEETIEQLFYLANRHYNGDVDTYGVAYLEDADGNVVYYDKHADAIRKAIEEASR